MNYFNILQNDDEDDFVMVGANNSDQAVPAQPTELEEGEIVETPASTNTTNTTNNNHVNNTNGVNGKPNAISKQPQYTIDLQLDFSRDSVLNSADLTKTFDESWVLWFDSKKSKESKHASTSPDHQNSHYLQNISKVGSFNMLEGLKQLWGSLGSPMNSNISLFKEGIEPAWEDVKNKDGGNYSVNYVIKDNEEYTKMINSWFTLVTTVVFASKWDQYEQTNGLVLSFRSWGASINVWNNVSENQEKVQALKDGLQHIFKSKYAKYSSHNNTILLKTYKRNDELKKKKNYKSFQKIDHHANQWNELNSHTGGFQSRNQEGWLSNDNDHSTNVFARGNYNNNGNGSWTSSAPNQLRKYKPQATTQHPVPASPEVTPMAEPAVPVPEIPAGMNAWSTGILLGNEPAPVQTPFVAREEPKPAKAEPAKAEPAKAEPVPAQSPTPAPVVEMPATKSMVEATTPPPTPAVVVPPNVNAWSTGLLLPKSPVVQSSEPATPAVAESNISAAANDSQQATSPTATNGWGGSNKVVEQHQKKTAKKDDERVPDRTVEKTPAASSSDKSEKKQQKKQTKLNTSNEKDAPFWEEPSKVAPAPVTEQAKSPATTSTAAATAAVPAKEIKSKQPKPVDTPAQPTSIWGKENVLRLMETVAKEEKVKAEPAVIVQQQLVQDNVVEAKEEQPTATRLTIQTKPLAEQKKVELPAAPAKDEWTAVEEKKPKKERKEPKEEDKKPLPVPQQHKEEKSLIRSLQVEEPIEYSTPLKQPKSASTSTTSNRNNNSNKNSGNKTSSTTTSKSVATHKPKNSNKSATATTAPNAMDSKLVGFVALFVALLLGLLLKYFLF